MLIKVGLIQARWWFWHSPNRIRAIAEQETSSLHNNHVGLCVEAEPANGADLAQVDERVVAKQETSLIHSNNIFKKVLLHFLLLLDLFWAKKKRFLLGKAKFGLYWQQSPNFESRKAVFSPIRPELFLEKLWMDRIEGSLTTEQNRQVQ